MLKVVKAPGRKDHDLLQEMKEHHDCRGCWRGAAPDEGGSHQFIIECHLSGCCVTNG
jgi:hypothetical protein